MKRSMITVAVAAALFCGTAGAADRENLVPASPALKALAGFGPDEELWVPAESGATAPQNYFGASAVMTGLQGTYFQPRISTTQWISGGGGAEMNYQSGDNFVDAHIDVPSGVLLDGFRWWAVDSVAADVLFFVIRVCLPESAGGTQTFTAFGPVQSTGATGPQSGTFTFTTPLQVDNNTCNYFARVNFQGGVGIQLQKVRLQWHRQVSAAPATATFTDVPTSHPFFRFVEAMVAAGITGGCGGGNYCPNANLTRGEMAVFLSAALGLHFPN